ncbi:MAG: tRNA uridine-5-carboxymethylaminomethyl(34) synthesis GTPase MnmE [Candidatus Sericytochromatia bacterium]|nr:tRNA uridine-5-carboxymethylaminomethyl(34) synthesis GTPase MnmE [Candidatus Sericytochromatia bacterium]
MRFDTIAAIATAQGPAAVAIIRVSGPDALRIAERLFRNGARQEPRVPLSARASHQAHVGWLVDPATGQPVDQALVLVMRGPRSFTGEDVVEFQTHGGLAATRTLELVLAQGARLAAPGEFSKRAFLLGRLDLSQAEAIGDVVEAHGERALAVALNQLEGRLSRQLAETRDQLVGLLARLEAAIDFPDEIDDVGADEADRLLSDARRDLAAVLATAHEGQVLREGVGLALVGRPNAGKSSLLNALLGRERAIVTPVAGTTRDVLEESLMLGGVWYRIVDTAGIRATEDAVEAIGVARSQAALAAADVVLLVCDLTAPIDEREHDLVAAARGKPLLVVANKADTLSPGAAGAQALSALATLGPVCAVSALTGAGLDELGRRLSQQVQGAAPTQPAVAINARHRQCLAQAQHHLEQAHGSARAGMAADFLAIDVKATIAALGEVTGDAITETVIEEVFRRFCVGK